MHIGFLLSRTDALATSLAHIFCTVANALPEIVSFRVNVFNCLLLSNALPSGRLPGALVGVVANCERTNLLTQRPAQLVQRVVVG